MTIYAEVPCPKCDNASIWPMPKVDEKDWPTVMLCDECWERENDDR